MAMVLKAEEWHLVAIAYKAKSGEHKLCMEEDVHNNWVQKLCNNFKNPQAVPVTLRTRFAAVLSL